ncbi:MAG: hypothetical protein QXJ06_00475 [Candidatus Aenigmatarchaeota archaeon]
MRKGINALEIVFGMFLLLIVVFVVIRLVINFVTPSKIAGQLDSFDQAYRFSQEKSTCKNLCDEYTTEECNRMAAVKYCMQKINIDIDGNRIAGEKNHGGFVTQLPYCEDGLYCFHIYECRCGTYKLDRENCRKILCEYYVKDQGIDDREEVSNLIYKAINFGTCDPNIENWGLKELPTKQRASWWAEKAGFSVFDEIEGVVKPNPDVCYELLGSSLESSYEEETYTEETTYET